METNEPEVKEITRDALAQKRRNGEPFILVDVLSHDHFMQVHIPGAINVPVNLLHDLAPLLFSPADEIIVYCANFHCTASVTAAKLLLRHGYEHVFDYTGGIMDWEEGGLPVTRAIPPQEKAA